MKTLLALAFAAGIAIAASPAGAAPAAPPVPHTQASDVVHVRDGCGMNRHRNGIGRCVWDGRRWGWRNDWRWRHRGWRGDGCDRWHHRDRWGHCARNW